MNDVFTVDESSECGVFGPAALYAQVIKTRRHDRVVRVERRAVSEGRAGGDRSRGLAGDERPRRGRPDPPPRRRHDPRGHHARDRAPCRPQTRGTCVQYP